ncbi:uncharacterized protein YndB with AHSA1/START domain [Beijerinckia sp. GAS462]|nr:uncharacterized protein YndB with AHSA1/START domain [Beijerinckia sp. GAS462]SEC65123.1 Polyketide cyclase / dehydrase and lipid transport [Beijerinckia sp. 28-YEA-48]
MSLSSIIILILVVLVAILAYAWTRPDTFTVQRSLTIAAPPDRLFPLINDFNNWPAWSPYEHRDPNMSRTIGGAPNGRGATYAWEGNKNVGKGRMEILESHPPSMVTIKLDFERPFEAHNMAEFTLRPVAGGTNVIWAMHGTSPFITKLIGIFISMDKMIGNDFETGLAKLKGAVES